VVEQARTLDPHPMPTPPSPSSLATSHAPSSRMETLLHAVSRPLLALHAFLAEAPDHLEGEHRDQYALTNWCMVLALCTHLSYLAVFWALQVRPLMLFNICSVLLFSVCLVIAKRGWSNSAMAVASVEVAAHAVFATLMLGFPSGFHYHLLLVVVVTFLFTGMAAITRVTTVAAVGMGYVVLATATVRATPWVALEPVISDRLAALNVVVFVTTLAGICWYYTLAVTLARRALREEFQRSEALLHNVLPVAVAERLKVQNTIADHFDACTVLFADMAGFTAWSARMEPEELVERLNAIFSAYDEMAEELGLEKIKTIGDAYMVAAGIPEPRADHAEAMARMALRMKAWVEALRLQDGSEVEIRIGIHSGPAVAGVIGLRKFIYDLWGDTVNTAARMESHGVNGAIQISETTARLLGDRFELQPREPQEIKGKGVMRTFLLLGERGAA
jgi:adenylate cyclase